MSENPSDSDNWRVVSKKCREKNEVHSARCAKDEKTPMNLNTSAKFKSRSFENTGGGARSNYSPGSLHPRGGRTARGSHSSGDRSDYRPHVYEARYDNRPHFRTNETRNVSGQQKSSYEPKWKSKNEHNSHPRKSFAVIPNFNSPEEEQKFTELKKEIPHLMMPGRIRRIKAKLNIDKLDEMVLSDEWIQVQREGWTYGQVIDPDKSQLPAGIEGEDYIALQLDNGWGDMVIFVPVSDDHCDDDA